MFHINTAKIIEIIGETEQYLSSLLYHYYVLMGPDPQVGDSAVDYQGPALYFVLSVGLLSFRLNTDIFVSGMHAAL